jgi:hypothetical protein
LPKVLTQNGDFLGFENSLKKPSAIALEFPYFHKDSGFNFSPQKSRPGNEPEAACDVLNGRAFKD